MRLVLYASCGAVVYDKFAARRAGLQRVPEAYFYALALVASAPALAATLLALWVCNHKTRKTSFKIRWAAAAAANQLARLWWR